MITKFEELFESISNQKLAEYYINKLISEIEKNFNFDQKLKFYKTQKYFTLIIPITKYVNTGGLCAYVDMFDKQSLKILENIIKKYQRNIIHTNILLSYKILKNGIDICLKNLYTQRYLPSGFLYHVSYPQFREEIKKYGLIPHGHDEGHYKTQNVLYYPPAIFASPSEIIWLGGGDIWKIDTAKIDNKWWLDLNITEEKTKRYLMTFEPIPPENLELIKFKKEPKKTKPVKKINW